MDDTAEALESEGGDEGNPYVIAGWDSRAPAPGVPPRTLRAARVIAEALYSSDVGPPPPARLDWLERDLGDFFGHTSLRARLLFRACIATIFWLAPLFSGRFATMASLDTSARIDALHRFERTPLALTLLATKAIVSLVWFEHPDSAAEIGWNSECKLP